ncbi:MAG: hypothetical protein ACKN9U_04415, partial [Pirellulaceae bacterium]
PRGRWTPPWTPQWKPLQLRRPLPARFLHSQLPIVQGGKFLDPSAPQWKLCSRTSSGPHRLATR